jgi:hypothetical protein
MPETVSIVLRLFLTVMFFAVLVVPTFWEANVKLAGVTSTGTIPVPVKLTACGLLFALSVIVSAALFAPGVAGANVTLILQDEWPPTLDPHVFEDTANSPAFVPVMATLDIGKVALVLFASVAVLGALVLSSPWFPKEKVAVDRVTCKTPVPNKATVCGLFTALSVTISVADRAPDTAGVKLMLIMQDFCNPSVLPHVLADWAKSVEFLPRIAMEDIVTTRPVLLVTVTCLTALVLLMPWLP